jgi:hypothetical protein
MRDASTASVGHTDDYGSIATGRQRGAAALWCSRPARVADCRRVLRRLISLAFAAERPISRVVSHGPVEGKPGDQVG